MQRLVTLCLGGAVLLASAMLCNQGAAAGQRFAKLTPSALGAEPAAADQLRRKISTERDEAKRSPVLRPAEVKPLGDYPLESNRHLRRC